MLPRVRADVPAGHDARRRQPVPRQPQIEYDDVLAAWREYPAKDNKGRGFVLIGHSGGGICSSG